jgi:hypothetical protein
MRADHPLMMTYPEAVYEPPGDAIARFIVYPSAARDDGMI